VSAQENAAQRSSNLSIQDQSETSFLLRKRETLYAQIAGSNVVEQWWEKTTTPPHFHFQRVNGNLLFSPELPELYCARTNLQGQGCIPACGAERCDAIRGCDPLSGAIAFALERWAVTWNRCRVHGDSGDPRECGTSEGAKQEDSISADRSEGCSATSAHASPHTSCCRRGFWPRRLYITPLNRCRATTE